ncbi:MAG: relaxase/mobilization nuclease RlxS [Alphaproteobacteria bacterium]|nr:relaxase/mobilization nuclease RlxS [Alphaproteobacteria bacterium]
MRDEEFVPQLGKIGNRGFRSGRRYANQVLAAVNRAGGQYARKGAFTGKRFGRGGATAALLASRDRYAAFRQRRVTVKARIVRLAGKGMDRATSHMRYIQRDGVNREGERGELYGPDHDRTDGKAFLERSGGDRHQFRFIVAPEDGREYEDLKPLTRRLMEQMEQDLDTRLDWVAVDHFNTGHPHTHIIVRGKDDLGQDLVISPSYISEGIRERAAELVRIDLGPRTDREIEMGLNVEMTAERLTSLDRHLLRMKEIEKGVSPFFVNDVARQTLLAGRLKHLERLGLAEERRPGQWHIDDDLEGTLRRMGERGDIIKTMHREMTEKNIVHSAVDYDIYDPTALGAKPVVGRVVARGLSDEFNDRHYLIVDSTDGQALYIDIGRGDATGPTPEGSIVRVTPRSLDPRQVDRTVVEVAAANGGQYNIDLHLKYDERATDRFAETHVRRLEAIRRATKGVSREPDGTWIIAPDHLDRVKEYERLQAKREPVIVDKLSSLSLEQQVGTDGATWLDRQLVSGHTEATGDSGFGKEVQEALRRRQQWLIEQGLAHEEQNQIIYRANMLSALQRREVSRVSKQLSEQLGLRYVETHAGETVEGTLRKSIELASGKFAVIEKSREFTLVPWRPVLERHIGKQVSGIMRSDGISWTIGRQRGIGIS